MRALILFAFLGLVFSQCPQPANPCSTIVCSGGCNSGFDIIQIQTDSKTVPPQTLVKINATNYCPKATGGVYYAQFSLTDAKGVTLTPVNLPNPFTGIYQWATSVVQDAGKTWVRFTSKDSGGINTKMTGGGGGSQWEIFSFVVTGYKPLFQWSFQLHTGPKWDTAGPIDASLCQCTNCDAGFSQRTVLPCIVGYANAQGVYSGSTNRASSVFNENQVLYSYGIYNNLLALFYSDEYPMTLGVEKITNNLVAAPANVQTFPFSTGTQAPTCIYGNAIQFGSTSFDGLDPMAAIDANGPTNGCNEILNATGKATVGKTCGRPMTPTMFITDVSPPNGNSRNGDWQYYGTGYLPHKICGLWQSSTKTITGRNTDGTYVFSVVPVTQSLPPSNQNPVGNGNPPWNLGAGADPVPVGFVNPSAVGSVPYLNSYGVEVAWDLDKLPLIPSHSYRFQFLVHDGDSTKVGGDVGQACLITSVACPAGFSGTACDVCDTNPLPNDGSWTWFCSITGSQPPYILLKLPTDKVKQPPYAGNGFIPQDNFTDGEGYRVGCNCVRVTKPCPSDCCGNGICRDQNGTCLCTNKPAGFNATSCCLPPPVPPPPTCELNVTSIPGLNCTTCVSNVKNLACAWCPSGGFPAWDNRTLKQGQCITDPRSCVGVVMRTCDLPPPPPTCEANLTVAKGTNCTQCVSNTIGVSCKWCVNDGILLWQNASVVNGTCVSMGATCKNYSLQVCQIQPPPVTPTAPVTTIPACVNTTTAGWNNGTANNSCFACTGNRWNVKCAWCPSAFNVSDLAYDPNRTLYTGRCEEINKCGSPEFYTCNPPPKPPPKSCSNFSQNCGVCTANTAGLDCSWCPSSNTSNPTNTSEFFTVGSCRVPKACAPGPEVKVCTLPPPPVKCIEKFTPGNGTDCRKCISNYLNISCAWCPDPKLPATSNFTLTNGTCQEWKSCPGTELYECKVPELPCYNNGSYCSGNGVCINNTCVCTPNAKLNYTGKACEIEIPPPKPTCANITGVYNCSDCLAKGSILGLQCAWCPNTTNPYRMLESGVCTEDYKCGNSSFYACISPSLFLPPECADNCSGNGICVNVSRCRQIQNMEQGAYVIEDKESDQKLIYTCSDDNLNTSSNLNYSTVCICLDPYEGFNCGALGDGVNIVLASALAGGIIAAIVVLGILGLALCTGGAYAATSALAPAAASGLQANPLYVGSDAGGDNPLFA